MHATIPSPQPRTRRALAQGLLPNAKSKLRWSALAGLCLGACYTPLDELPADTVAVTQWFWEDESGFGFAEFFLQTDTCTVLRSETTRFTLNDQAPSWFELGGRGREPFDAFNPSCALPRASWEQSQAPEDPLVFRLEDEENALELVVTRDGEVQRCDFPSCENLDLATERPLPFRE